MKLSLWSWIRVALIIGFGLGSRNVIPWLFESLAGGAIAVVLSLVAGWPWFLSIIVGIGGIYLLDFLIRIAREDFSKLFAFIILFATMPLVPTALILKLIFKIPWGNGWLHGYYFGILLWMCVVTAAKLRGDIESVEDLFDASTRSEPPTRFPPDFNSGAPRSGGASSPISTYRR